MDDTTKVDDQDLLNHRLIEARPGWTISAEHVYKDNSKSAWKRNRKRPGWDAMLDAIERGELDAIVVYHGDRLIRQPYDLELLLNIASEKGILLASPTGTRNLDNPDDRFILRIEAAHSCRESDDKSRRQKNGHRRRAEQGLVRSGGRGGRSFGFETDGLTHRPSEVDLIRKAADRILDGELPYSIWTKWNDTGIRTTADGLWTHGTFGAMMRRPRYAGLMPDGESRAAWDRVLKRETWEAVYAVLDRRAALFTSDTATAKHLLTGWASCEPCGATVQVGQRGKQKQPCYRCMRRGCFRVGRSLSHLDAYVTGHVLQLLNDDRLMAELERPDDPELAREITELEVRKAEVEQQLARLVDLPHVKPELLAAAIAGFDERISGKRDRIAISARARLLLAHAGLTEEAWYDLQLHTRRALVRASYRVTIQPVAKMGPGFETETIILERQTG